MAARGRRGALRVEMECLPVQQGLLPMGKQQAMEHAHSSYGSDCSTRFYDQGCHQAVVRQAGASASSIAAGPCRELVLAWDRFSALKYT